MTAHQHQLEQELIAAGLDGDLAWTLLTEEELDADWEALGGAGNVGEETDYE